MAAFCIATGISPAEYKQLTLGEYAAILDRLESLDNG